MLDVHPPHQATHTWTDFFIHIATIVVGLLIAIGLEQSVEAVHHHNEAQDLREQMRGVFDSNLKLEPAFLARSDSFRSYMVELRHAVEARIEGHPLAQEPDRNDKRMRIFTSTPSLAPYEAAKENGTVALLSSGEVRLYNRVEIQREYLGQTINDWFHAIYELENFEKQFTDSAGSLMLTGVVTTPELSKLSHEELLEYRGLLAAVINATDRMRIRTIMFDEMGRAILDGATDELQMMSRVGERLGDNPWKKLEHKQ